MMKAVRRGARSEARNAGARSVSVKDVTLAILPRPAQAWVKGAVYRRNCRLDPHRYRAELERWYRLSKGRDCDLDHPRTMMDKLQWLKLYDSTPLKGRVADKYLARQWIADRVGEEFLVPLVGVWDSPDEIDFDSLPERFALKATHGSAWNILVTDKGALDVRGARRRMASWLALRKAMMGGFELHYEFCEPRIVCERFIQDETGGLRDYKFMTFDGDVQFAITVEGRSTRRVLGTYLPDWTRAPFEYVYDEGRAPDVPRPRGLEQMLALARELGKGFACARVDFYEVDGRVYVGEITFTCTSGLSDFRPPRYDLEFGQRLRLPEKKPFKGVML